MAKLKVDLNCDLGESFGVYTSGNDKEVIPFISSVNIACGFHAGDPSIMRKTVKMALASGVSIGAHPGLPDLAGFGRRQMAVTAEEVFDLVLYQTGALWAFVKAEGGKLQHVKPHGALYNMAAVDVSLAEAIAEAIYRLNPELILYGLAGSSLVEAGERLGLRTAHEVFADRSYQSDGGLTPRGVAGALILEEQKAAQQALRMVMEGKVRCLNGHDITIKADTICIHGDEPHAPEFARKIRQALQEEGVLIRSLV